MHNQGEWIADMRLAGASSKARRAEAGILPKSPKVPRGTARNLRRVPLQRAYLKAFNAQFG